MTPQSKDAPPRINKVQDGCWTKAAGYGVPMGIKVFDDFKGGAEGSRLYETLSRNAHEWDVQR